METREFLTVVQMDAEMLEQWLQAGWLLPEQEDRTLRFSEIDLARAQLIRDLQQDLGVNNEGIPVILDLLDQLHGLRRALREVLSTIDAQPEPKRRRIIEEMRATALELRGVVPTRGPTFSGDGNQSA
jgi:chaperone modulatory protein CbpM